MGGSDEECSVRQKQKVISLLGRNNILYEKVNIEGNSTEERPQIILNVATGIIDPHFGSKKDYRIEYLQRREMKAYLVNFFIVDLDMTVAASQLYFFYLGPKTGASGYML